MNNSNHYIDLNELNVVKSSHDKHLDTFIFLLKQCHSKILEYNKIHKTKFCYYKPPPYIVGKPLYNYFELVKFIMSELSKNGLYNILTEDGILISWDDKLLNRAEYDKLKQTLHSNIKISDNEISNTKSINQSKPSDTTSLNIEKKTPIVHKKKTKDDGKSIYHVNINDDLIPINFIK